MVGTDVLLRRWINLIRTQEVHVEAKRLAYNRLLGELIDNGSRIQFGSLFKVRSEF